MIVVALAQAAAGVTYTVTSTCDTGDASPDGTCSDPCCLRESIDEVNAGSGGDTIAFAIPGAGPHTITLGSALPTISKANTVIDGTTQSGTVCCTGWDCSAAVWKIRIDANGGDFNIIEFTLGATDAIVRGLELINDDPDAEYGLTFDTVESVTCNSIHGGRGGIAMSNGGTIGGVGVNDANVVYDTGEFGLTSRGTTGTNVITGNVVCLAPDGETDGGPMNYGIYAEDSVDLVITNNLAASCDVAGILTRSSGTVDTVVTENTLGPTRSGATTHCFGFTVIEDNGTGTSLSDNTLCPQIGCCNVTGLEEFDVTCVDHTLGSGNPYSQADCLEIVGGVGGVPTSFNPDAVCDPDVSGTCPAAVPTATPTVTATATATATPTSGGLTDVVVVPGSQECPSPYETLLAGHVPYASIAQQLRGACLQQPRNEFTIGPCAVCGSAQHVAMVLGRQTCPAGSATVSGSIYTWAGLSDQLCWPTPPDEVATAAGSCVLCQTDDPVFSVHGAATCPQPIHRLHHRQRLPVAVEAPG